MSDTACHDHPLVLASRTAAESGFRLVTGVRRGSASAYPAASRRYGTLEEARAGAAALLTEDRVWNVMIVRNDLGGGFVEWCSR
jgi:hypothetical protein